MPRGKKGTRKPAPKSGAAMKYDANASALDDAYGMLAELRRELSDSREDKDERGDLLQMFASCKDSQRAWILLEDYFNKLKLSRKDFPGDDWWEDVAAVTGKKRLEALSVVFLRTGRQMPAELSEYANLKRFKELEKSERERAIYKDLENWMFPPAPNHLDAPRASIRAVATPVVDKSSSGLHLLKIEFVIRRPRTGDRKKSLANLVDLTVRAAHEKELFPPEDWEFIEWITEQYAEEAGESDLFLSGEKLLQWLAHWGPESRLQSDINQPQYHFLGQLAELTPHRRTGKSKSNSTYQLLLPDGSKIPVSDAIFFTGRPTLILWKNTFYFLRNSPPSELLSEWISNSGKDITNSKSSKKTEKTEQELSSVRSVAIPEPEDNDSSLHLLRVDFFICHPSKGESKTTLSDLKKITKQTARKKGLFYQNDWEFIKWVTENFADEAGEGDLYLSGQQLLQWLAHWGEESHLQPSIDQPEYRFFGQLTELSPSLRNGTAELAFTHQLRLPDGIEAPIHEAVFFSSRPTLVLWNSTFYFLRNSPPQQLLTKWIANPRAPINKLSTRFITLLRRTHDNAGIDWSSLCDSLKAKPRFVFELHGDRLELRLQAKANDSSQWEWTGHEWKMITTGRRKPKRPQVLEDERLDPAINWLRQLDWFTPEPGLWIGDANENFLHVLASVWDDRPEEAEFLGNDAFQRLFLKPKRLKPKLIVKGSGIDWLSVSAEWEEEGLKLTKKDLESLAKATGRFVKLPNKGWVELDVNATQKAQETMADLGLDGLEPGTQKIAMEQAAHLEEESLSVFGDSKQAQKLRNRIDNFEGIPPTSIPDNIQAELRPYQHEGFDFLCHLKSMRLGGILADDMGLGKTLQTLTYLSWLKKQKKRGKSNPSLVICPASVMHNWRREAEKFTPDMSVLVLESGSARHRMRKKIPDHDIVVTNYSLLRRDLEDLQTYPFNAIVLDEAQFIKNPGAQVTQSVKQLKCKIRLALTGTPLENRLLDLWSITDFVQPGYLGDEKHFHETYDPGGGDGDEAVANRRIARKRLSSRLRPILLRRVKKQVAKDLPDRIEQRHDCELSKDQRKLYLAELKRSREKVMETIQSKGVAKSRMQVLAALTRLRQICCHPSLVGSDFLSGKTEALFDLLEPLVAQGEKVLVFSQFVQMLKILEKDCGTREIPTHMLTGETKDRQGVVNAFQESEGAGVFLLSLRAAGTGLNLTTASYVVLYDPWWNPAVEAQAIDRTHRIGQTKTVNAYKLIAPGTVEEKIWNLQQDKRQTISDVLGEEGFAKSLDKTDLEFLFSEN